MRLDLPLLVSGISVTADPCHVGAIFLPFDIKQLRPFCFSLYFNILIALLLILLPQSSCSLLVG